MRLVCLRAFDDGDSANYSLKYLKPQRGGRQECESTAASRAFVYEALARLGGRHQVGGEHLDGHVSLELDVAGEVDDPHPAAAELPLKRVLSGECCLEVEEFGGGLRHACTTSAAKGRFLAIQTARPLTWPGCMNRTACCRSDYALRRLTMPKTPARPVAISK